MNMLVNNPDISHLIGHVDLEKINNELANFDQYIYQIENPHD